MRSRRVEVLTRPERRRKWSDEIKIAIVAVALADGVVISDVARRYHALAAFRLDAAVLRRGVGNDRVTSADVRAGCRRCSGKHAFAATARPAARRDRDQRRCRDSAHPGCGRRQDAGGGAEGTEGDGVIVPPTGIRVLVAMKPVDFRRAWMDLLLMCKRRLRPIHSQA